MKRIACVLVILIMTSIPVFADVGLPPDNPLFTVVINLDGAQATNWDTETYLPGGVSFYVFREGQFDGMDQYFGTTNESLKGEDEDLFFWINKSDTLSPGEKISPQTGTMLDDKYKAVTTDALNMRTGPGTGFKVVELLEKGTEVEYQYRYDADSTWVYVTTGKQQGWVSGDYLKTTAKVKAANNPIPDDEKEEEDTKKVNLPIIIAACVAVACIITLIVCLILGKKNKQ